VSISRDCWCDMQVAKSVQIEKSKYDGRWELTIITSDDYKVVYLVRLYWLKTLLHILLNLIEDTIEDE